MDSFNQRCDAVLVYAKRRLFDADVVVRLVEKALNQKSCEILTSEEVNPGELLIRADSFVITVKTDVDRSDLMGRMMIAISKFAEDTHADAPLVLLADICRKSILTTEASQIVWLRKDVVFSAQQFLSAFAPVKPRRVVSHEKQLRPVHLPVASLVGALIKIVENVYRTSTAWKRFLTASSAKKPAKKSLGQTIYLPKRKQRWPRPSV